MRSSTQHHRRYSDRWTPADAHPRVAHAGAANANDGASVRAPECRVLECEDVCRRMARSSCSIAMRVDDVSRLAAESAGECMENTLEYTILGLLTITYTYAQSFVDMQVALLQVLFHESLFASPYTNQLPEDLAG